jgi:hypothetical protein
MVRVHTDHIPIQETRAERGQAPSADWARFFPFGIPSGVPQHIPRGLNPTHLFPRRRESWRCCVSLHLEGEPPAGARC